MTTKTKTPDRLRAVIYTDGGFRQTSGLGGWGMHGYTYRAEKAKQGTGCKAGTLTSKGYIENAKLGAVDPEKLAELSAITVTSYVNAFGTLQPPTTNNVAELTALTRAIEFSIEQKFDHVLIRADSEYCIKGYQQSMDKWAANGWRRVDGGEVKNVPQWERLLALRNELKTNEIQLEFLWVKGHSGEIGNETVDAHASRAITAGLNGAPVEFHKEDPAQGYWSKKTDRSRMICQPHWYFSALSMDNALSPDGRWVYYTGFSGKGKSTKDGDDKKEVDPIELWGKKNSDSRYTIVYLKEPEPVLEALRAESVKMAQGRYLGLTVGELREILNPTTYLELQEYSSALLKRDYARLRLSKVISAAEEILLTREVRPARLAFEAIDTINMLEAVLQHHISQRNHGAVISTDITDILYEADAGNGKKKPVFKLKGHITNTLRALDVKAKYAGRESDLHETELKLTLSLDLADRNTLAALAGESTRAYVVTWPESNLAIRYATIVEADGDIALWCSAYANLQLLKPHS